MYNFFDMLLQQLMLLLMLMLSLLATVLYSHSISLHLSVCLSHTNESRGLHYQFLRRKFISKFRLWMVSVWKIPHTWGVWHTWE